MLRTARVLHFCAVQRARSGGLRCPPALVAIPTSNKRPHLAVRDRALEHPEAAVGMDVLDASRPDRPLRGLDRARDGVRGLDFGALDVNYTDTHPDLRAQIPEHRQLLDRPVRAFHDDVVDVQRVEIIDELAARTALHRLPAGVDY